MYCPAKTAKLANCDCKTLLRQEGHTNCVVISANDASGEQFWSCAGRCIHPEEFCQASYRLVGDSNLDDGKCWNQLPCRRHVGNSLNGGSDTVWTHREECPQTLAGCKCLWSWSSRHGDPAPIYKDEVQPDPAPNDLPAVWGMVMKDMVDRDQIGRKRYGTPLQPHNGRDVLRDAYEEALDLAVYLRQAIYERDNPQ